MIRVLNVVLRIKKDKQVNMGKISLLELNGVNMSYSSTKETIINELEECFLLTQQNKLHIEEKRKRQKDLIKL